MKCKILVNTQSGNCDRLDLAALKNIFGQDAVVTTDMNSDCTQCDTVVLCGGDGTLHNAVNRANGQKIFYVPCGTLNEAARNQKSISSVGRVNGENFAYVCAAGTFTEIGYTTPNRHKKRWKAVAYLPQILKTFRCHEIQADLQIDNKKMSGKFTLLMVLKSHRCFGFCFNNDYKKTQKTYLVAVKSAGKDNLVNRAKIFLPFFRIFFTKPKPQIAKNWLLLPFDRLQIFLKCPQRFCFDGEKRLLAGRLDFCTQTLDPPLQVLHLPRCGHKKERFCSSKALLFFV